MAQIGDIVRFLNSVGGAMNLITGVKHFMSDKKVAGIISEVATVVLGVLAFVCYRAIGG